MNARTRTTPLGLTAAAFLVVAGPMADAQETAQGDAAQVEPTPIEAPEIELPEIDPSMGNEGEDEQAADELTGSEQPAEIVLDEHYEVSPGDDDYPVGIDDPDAGAETATLEEESPQEQLQRYFMLYKAALENKAYLEADTLAKRVVELSIELFGVNSVDSARALTNLGIAQHQNDNYEAAILNYNAAIDIIERVEDRLNSNLVNPLKGRGAAELASGQPDQAVESFERAVHISHVNEGPHNLEQVEILESLAETFLSVGELDEVEDIQAHIFSLEARDVQLDSLDAIPALERQARWQHRLQFFEKERYTWRKIIEIIEERRSEDDLSLIAPLTDLGKSYLYVGEPSMAFHQPSSVSSGEIYLKRALRIAESNPEATWKTKEETMLALGDFYILSGKPGRAEKIYSETWQLLSGDEEKLKDRHDHLETLVRLVDAQPPMYVGIDGEVRSDLPGDTYQTGKIVYDYSVSSRGLTTGIDMVEAEPAGFEDMERAVLNNLRAMMHRPRLVEGSAVQTDDLVYTHKFFYRESDLVEMQREADLAATN
ncbi:MAG TPA: tetratricopeptide repeat protein [Woeseiaceae bacterium]|nr:tetratricopeptide repeat protein [Woeseiaceae bacterium]